MTLLPVVATRVPMSPHLHQHLLSLCFITAILEGVRHYLIVILIGRSLMADNMEHLFMPLLAMILVSLDLWRSVYSNLLPVFKLCCLSRSGL